MADTLDVLTLAEAKTAVSMGQSVTSKDTILAVYVTATSRLLDRHLGPIVQRTITGEAHDGNCSNVWLTYGPVASVSSVVEYSGTTPVTLDRSSVTNQPGYGYTLRTDPYDPALFSRRLSRRSGGYGWPFAWGSQNVIVTYVAGRYANTTSVDARFKEAAGVLLENLWRTQQVGVGQVGEYDVPTLNFPGFAVPNAVKQMFPGEWDDHPQIVVR